MKMGKQSEDGDPWIRHVERWEIRVMKIAVFCGVVIFAVKLLLHELAHFNIGPSKPAIHGKVDNL